MTQPTALFLADILEDGGKPADIAEKAAAELRRLHAELERCKQVCAADIDRHPDRWTPLYTAPSQRKPLTEEAAWALVEQDSRMEEYGGTALELIRKVERAHGIK